MSYTLDTLGLAMNKASREDGKNNFIIDTINGTVNTKLYASADTTVVELTASLVSDNHRLRHLLKLALEIGVDLHTHSDNLVDEIKNLNEEHQCDNALGGCDFEIGDVVYDSVTEIIGTITRVCSYVDGSFQVFIEAELNDNGIVNTGWFEQTRLVKVD